MRCAGPPNAVSALPAVSTVIAPSRIHHASRFAGVSRRSSVAIGTTASADTNRYVIARGCARQHGVSHRQQPGDAEKQRRPPTDYEIGVPVRSVRILDAGLRPIARTY